MSSCPFFYRHVKNVSRAKHLRDSLEFFSFVSWVFHSRNTSALSESLTPNDQSLFPFNPVDIEWKSYVEQYSQGVRKYLSQIKSGADFKHALHKDKVVPTTGHTQTELPISLPNHVVSGCAKQINK